jgi:hypothetical protein
MDCLDTYGFHALHEEHCAKRSPTNFIRDIPLVIAYTKAAKPDRQIGVAETAAFQFGLSQALSPQLPARLH